MVPQDSDQSSDKLLSKSRDVRQASQLEKVMPPLLMDRTMTENDTPPTPNTHTPNVDCYVPNLLDFICLVSVRFSKFSVEKHSSQILPAYLPLT